MDFHTHTDNSPDAVHSVMLLCERACQIGLRAIAITDHCECHAYKKDRYDLTARQSFFEATKARSVFSGQLIVLRGVELGQPLADADAAAGALSRPLDFVLASQHCLAGKEDFYYMDYTLPENDPHELLHLYFSQLTDIVGWGKFDSLAHLTYPLRYITGVHGIQVDITHYYDQMDRLFRLMARTGKALEINTSGLRQELGTALPDLSLLRRFKEAGGEYITIGSDAHRADDIGAGVEEGMALAAVAGFKYVTLYQNRVPVQIPLI
ncbi:MAG: histidinol-phosphatase HisJ family protein [Clostridiales bacterium]|nr:histidinol-phosphatase HisJ family protein [Clostridiales bacterium]